jgi:amino acid efflux transporter
MCENKLKRSLNWQQGTALSISAVIGCGILILPSVTAQKSGPASIVAWIITSFLIFPIVFVLGKLSVRVPKAGGIASYATTAFGPKAGIITSWIFLGSIPIGLPTVALSGAYYLSYVIPLNSWQVTLVAAIILSISITLNIKGIDISSKISSIVVTIIIILLISSVIFSIFHVKVSAFHPFIPYGYKSVYSTFPVIFFAFAGWEMIAPLAEEFKNPSRDIPVSLFLSSLFIVVLYISISFVTIGTSIYKSKNGLTPLSSLISLSFGKTSGCIVAVLTVLITFCTIHANTAGFSRIIYNEAREGEFPQLFATLHYKFKTPINVLIVLGIDFALVLICFTVLTPDISTILKFPGSVFLASYIIAMASALKILDRKNIGWWCALISLLICLIVYFLGGIVSLFPIVLGIMGWFFTTYINTKQKNNNVK